MGRRVVPEAFFWMLHVVIFVVWFPAVFVAQRLVGNVNRKDLWKVVLKDSPDSMRDMVYGLFGYAVVNFLFFMTKAPSGGSGANPPAVKRPSPDRAYNFTTLPSGHARKQRCPHLCLRAR